jgi:hypothetical protein
VLSRKVWFRGVPQPKYFCSCFLKGHRMMPEIGDTIEATGDYVDGVFVADAFTGRSRTLNL